MQHRHGRLLSGGNSAPEVLFQVSVERSFRPHPCNLDDSVAIWTERTDKVLLDRTVKLWRRQFVVNVVFVNVFFIWCPCSHLFVTSCSVGAVTVDYRTSVVCIQVLPRSTLIHKETNENESFHIHHPQFVTNWLIWLEKTSKNIFIQNWPIPRIIHW